MKFWPWAYMIPLWAVVCAAAFPDTIFRKPDHFPAPVYFQQGGRLDNKKVELGRRLFYDPILSADSTISCASCHSPYNAFAHVDHDLSHGIQNRIGLRNAPALMNLAWQPVFMMDGAINHLDVQALAPIAHPDEMGSDIQEVVKKLSRNSSYVAAFKQAFGGDGVTGETVLKALAQFQLTLVSATAKYDSVMQRRAQFTEQERRGYEVFQMHCNRCHTEPLFTNYSFASNGLPLDTTLNDFGRMRITHDKADSLLFKVPTLRNLEFSFPYMHDGRFRTLSEVLNHYQRQVKAPSADPRVLQENISLSSHEKVDLMAFLLTLSDHKFVFDKKHGFPKGK